MCKRQSNGAEAEISKVFQFILHLLLYVLLVNDSCVCVCAQEFQWTTCTNDNKLYSSVLFQMPKTFSKTFLTTAAPRPALNVQPVSHVMTDEERLLASWVSA